ncbi:hypothetical protein HMPREF9123_2897 [Neisseria bacilliformis ATCC BAA-1200]|uniref:Uncharacterized protein n=1 Tax=Neisseria bacilliformis ATCC BAA-1200 TaxID=888742 RepID=F2BGP0_9NEIS|nr:hypothetical protein HMPREF9123_2897 [Neisseria bacilliformis ATCC BAA-1200]
MAHHVKRPSESAVSTKLKPEQRFSDGLSLDFHCRQNAVSLSSSKRFPAHIARFHRAIRIPCIFGCNT